MAEMDNCNSPVDDQYYLLLISKMGERREKRRSVFPSSSSRKKFVSVLKGEILTQDREKDQPKDETLIRLTPIERPSVTLECPTTEVQRIDHEEANLLLPLCSLSERLRVFGERNRLEFGKKMNIDSEVWVDVPVNGIRRVFTLGVIRYKGQVPGTPGTMFGVELLNQKGKGSTNGSFKGKQYFRCKKDSGVFVSLERLTSPSSKRTSKSSGDSEIKTEENMVNVDSGKNKDEKEKKESSRTSMLTNQSIINSIERDIEHKVGDAVWVFIEEKPKRGIIKYIGCLPGEKLIFAGICLDQKCGQGDGVYYGRRLFSCPYDYAYFTPMTNVISEKMFAEMYEQPGGHRKLNLKEKAMSFTQQSSSDDIVQMESSFAKRSKEDIIREQKEILEKSRGEAFFRRLMESAQERKSGSGFTPDSNREMAGLELKQQNTTHDHPSGPIETSHEKLAIGSMVEVPSKVSSPKYGVIRWIGFTPNITKKVAGIELEEELEACSDGTFLGRRYFTCPLKRGFFVYLHSCQPDSRRRSGNSPTSRDRRLTGVETSSSSEVEIPLMEAQELKSGSGFTPDGNKDVSGLELGEKNVSTGATSMNAGAVAQIESLLTCTICLEMLTDSRTLGCHHSFCKCCLEGYVKRQRKEASAKPAQEKLVKSVEEFECPDCRTPFSLKQGQGVEAIPRSHLVNNMLEVVQRSAKEIPPKRCENQEKLKVEKAYCKIHEKRELEFYCENCEEIICSYCMAFNHGKENHSFLPAEDVAEKERETIKQCSNSLEENLNEANEALQEISNVTRSLGKHAEEEKEKITRQKDELLGTLFRALSRNLEKKAELMMNFVDEKHNEACQQLEIQKSEIEEYIKVLSNSVDLSKNLLYKGTIEEILSSKKMFREKMEKAKNGRPRRMKPVHDGLMEFEIETVNLASIVNDLERIDLTMQVPKKKCSVKTKKEWNGKG